MRKKKVYQDNLKNYVKALAVFVVFIMVSLIVFFYCVQKNVEENVSETIKDNVERQGYHFRSIMDEQYGHLRAVASFIGQHEELITEEHMHLICSVAEQSGMERLAIIDEDGTSHYDSGEIKNVADRSYFKRAMQGSAWFSDPLVSVVDGKPRIVLSVPVYRNKKIVGVVGGSYNVGALSHILFEDIYDGAGCSILVTGSGAVVTYDGDTESIRLSPDDNFFDYYDSMRFFDDGSIKRVRTDFNLQRPGRWKVSYENRTSYLSYAPLGLNGWMLCYLVPLETAEEPYSFIRQYEIAMMEFFALAVFSLFLALYRMNLRRQQELIRSARNDALTGCYNKKSTEEEIDHWLREERCVGCQAFLMLDIDKFKEINDVFGHAAGDQALEKVGTMLRRQFREDDVIGRVGGDEFVVLMKNISGPRDAAAKAEELCRMFRTTVLEKHPALHLTCSIGLAYAPEHGKTYMEIYQCADKALYQTKQRGRNGYTCFCTMEKEQNFEGK